MTDTRSRAVEAISTAKRTFLRPQLWIPGFLEFRKQINHKVFQNQNPLRERIISWTITKEMQATEEVSDQLNIVWVNTESRLEKAVEVIRLHRELMVDTERNSKDSYLGMICTIQISTPTVDFVIDALKLYNKISELVGPILSDSKILKVIHSSEDIQYLQRDFGIYCSSVVDSQEFFQILNGINKIAFEKMVDKYAAHLSHLVDKRFQRANWTRRPLTKGMATYAALDTKLLFVCWTRMKKELSTPLTADMFPMSNAACLKMYRVPKRRTPAALWAECMQSLCPDLRKVFETQSQFNLFFEILEWRQKEAKLLDLPPLAVVSLDKISLITRALPDTAVHLNKLLQTSETLTDVQSSELLQIFEKYRVWTTADNQVTPLLDSNGLAMYSGSPPGESMQCEFQAGDVIRNPLTDQDNWDVDVIMEDARVKTDCLNEKPRVLNPVIKKKKKYKGVADKVKYVFAYAKKLKLKKEDLLRYMHKFPGSK